VRDIPFLSIEGHKCPRRVAIVLRYGYNISGPQRWKLTSILGSPIIQSPSLGQRLMGLRRRWEGSCVVMRLHRRGGGWARDGRKCAVVNRSWSRSADGSRRRGGRCAIIIPCRSPSPPSLWRSRSSPPSLWRRWLWWRRCESRSSTTNLRRCESQSSATTMRIHTSTH